MTEGTHASPAREPLPFLGSLAVVGLVLLAWTTLKYVGSPSASEGGLDVQARAYLRSRNITPLSGSLEQVLAGAASGREPSLPHALLGQAAPDFQLADHRQKVWQLSAEVGKGPVVVVFYYGYYCNHCVGQLFAIHQDAEKFQELGGRILAISADESDLTQERFKQYGEFAFPVLSDPGNKTAAAYGIFNTTRNGKPVALQHGTFVIGRNGRLTWCHYGDQPFMSNRTLLYQLAMLEGRLPLTKP